LFIALLVVAALLVGAGVTKFTESGVRSLAAAPLAGLERPANAAVAPAASSRINVTNQLPAAPAQVAAQPVTINIQPGADAESQILEAVYTKVNPSVVQVVNLARSSGRLSSAGALPQGEGSGFVWDTQGYIVTNDHVVDGADKLQVFFYDGTQADATLVATDPGGDIAVIKVDPNVATLVPVDQGNMADVKVGEMAIAIGNPFGFQGTMTRGIVSAIGRTIPSQTTFNIPKAIQTDASINPGNSGGPLLNSSGQVIGVNDQIQSSNGSSSGVGFAIPISIVQRIVPALLKGGQYQHSYLGISGGTYSKAWAQALGLPANAKGVYLMDVAQGSPAATAGLQGGSRDTSVLLGSGRSGLTYLQSGGDLITAVDGQPLSKIDDLLVYLEEHTSPGQTVKLTVLRNGQSQTIDARLTARPAQTTS
jgi:S1-C subfamily serine protease